MSKDTNQPPPIPEAGFQRTVIDAALANGWLVFHDNDSRKNRKGFPDLVLVRPPVVLFLELKTEEGDPTDEQQEWIDKLKRCNIIEADVARPHHLDGDILPALTSRAR